MCPFRKGEISLIFEKPKVTSTCHYLNNHKKKKCHNQVKFCGSMAFFHPGWLASIMMKCLHNSIKNPRVEQEFQWPLENGWARAELTGNQEHRALPMTTKLRSCFPPCRFSSSALISICCLSLPDFFSEAGVVLCSSDVWMVWDGRADFVSRASEVMLVSSPWCPFWGVWKWWPFSSVVSLQNTKVRNEYLDQS